MPRLLKVDHISSTTTLTTTRPHLKWIKNKARLGYVIFTTAFTFEHVNLIFEASQLGLCYSIMSVRVGQNYPSQGLASQGLPSDDKR